MCAIRASVAHNHTVDIKIATHWSYDFLGGLHLVTGAHLFVIIRQVVSCAARQNHQVDGTATEKHADMHLDYDSHGRVDIGGGTRSNSLWLVLYLLQSKTADAHIIYSTRKIRTKCPRSILTQHGEGHSRTRPRGGRRQPLSCNMATYVFFLI
jgi:hypothetical protein